MASAVTPIRERGLLEHHRRHLAETSGLDDETITRSRVYSSSDPKHLAELLGWRAWKLGPALVFPYFVPGSDEPAYSRVRPDRPRTGEKKGDGTAKPVKYEQPKGRGVFPFFPPRSRARLRGASDSGPVVFVEGEKKALLMDQLGYTVVGGSGVWCFHDVEHRTTEDRYRLHAAIREHVPLEGRECLICFDSDAADPKKNVLQAARVLAGMLAEAGASSAKLVTIPPRANGSHRGIDDLYVEEGERTARDVLLCADTLPPAPLDDSSARVGDVRALADAPVLADLRIPYGYDVDRHGVLWALPEEGEGKPKQIERSCVLIKRVLEDVDSGELRVELAFRGASGWRTAIVDRQAIADTRACVNAFAPLGIPVDSKTAGDVVRWLRDFEHKNQRRLPRERCSTSCGWRDGVFVLAEPVGAEGVSLDTRHGRGRVAAAVRVRGEEGPQLEVLKRAWEADPHCAIAIAAALAAPLLKLLGAPNFAVHLAGDSSRGKSSMLKIAASLYGDPTSEEWITSWNATTVGLERRAAVLNDLPLCVDEAGVVDAQQRERSVYMLINGSGRVRGDRDGLRDVASWRTVVISTGEHLLATEGSAAGAQVRVLQYYVHGFGELGAAEVDALRAACEEHYGAVGRRWLEWLLSEVAGDVEEHRSGLKDFAKVFRERAGDGLEARQAGFYAVLGYAEALATEALGIGTEGQTILRFFEGRASSSQVVQSAASRALDLVADWLVSEQAAFGEIGMDADGKSSLKAPHLGREVHGYRGAEAVLIVPKQLDKFLAGHGLSREVVLREWARLGWTAVNEPSRGTRRAKYGGQMMRFVCLRLAALGQANDEINDVSGAGSPGSPEVPQ